MTTEREIDHVTGVETTGHEWDGIKELNKPLPRWWLYTFYACIIWAIGYMIAYPAWPTLSGYTKGMLGYSRRAELASELKTAEAAQSGMRNLLQKTSLDQVKSNPELLRFAMSGGGVAFQTNCAPCHGRGAQGFKGYPNLNDDDWIWGGSLKAIEQTINYGIRNDNKNSRISDMPKFGIDKLLNSAQISDVAEYVLSLSGQSKNTAAIERGGKIFKEQCVACHGDNAKGNKELGAPNLTDAIWLYGGTRDDIRESIRTGRGGSMPAWTGRLDPTTIKSLAVYVHSLGGGQ